MIGRVVRVQAFLPWASLTTRLWKGAGHVEVEWTAGPIPFHDGLGRELSVRQLALQVTLDMEQYATQLMIFAGCLQPACIRIRCSRHTRATCFLWYRMSRIRLACASQAIQVAVRIIAARPRVRAGEVREQREQRGGVLHGRERARDAAARAQLPALLAAAGQ